MENADNETPEKKVVDDTDRLRELRERLYSRGETAPKQTPNIEEVPSRYTTPPTPEQTIPDPSSNPIIETPAVEYRSEPMSSSKTRKRFRTWMLILGGVFFAGALLVASVIMLAGNNTISGENITIGVEGPIAVGGGEEVPLTITVTNQNTVPIESVILRVEYPRGMHSIDDDKALTVERRELPTIAPGELLNIPIRTRAFGEENEEKEIKVSIDYRVSGSNATFDKKSEPYRFKISTSPVIVSIDSIEKITSGQELEVTYTVQSNAPTPQDNLLVKVAYPKGFDVSSTKPDPLSSDNVWRIETLKPAEKKTIRVKGVLSGYSEEKHDFTATVGVAKVDNEAVLGSMLAKSTHTVTLEKPFITLETTINRSNGESVVIGQSDVALVEIIYENAHDSALYAGKLDVVLDGNALNEYRVDVSNGFYDSTNNTIRWISAEVPELEEILPGERVRVSFSLLPKNGIGRTPQIKFSINAEGKRVGDSTASGVLTGTVARTIKVESSAAIANRVLYKDSPFKNSGPIPPRAEKVTQYALMFAIEAGSNDLTGAEMTAVLPQYVTWLDLTTDEKNITFNPTTRTIKWNIGELKSLATKEVAVQVAFSPSLTQVDTVPTLLETQRFKATDRFTGGTIRTEHAALTTSLYFDADIPEDNGRVQDK